MMCCAQHEPDHVLLRATYADAGTGLLDIARLAAYADARQGANRDAPAGPRVASGGAGAAGNLRAKWWRARRMRICCAKRRTS